MNGLILTFVLLIAVLLIIAYKRHRLCHTPDGGDLEAALDSEVNRFIKKGHSYGVVVGVYKEGRSSVKGYGAIEQAGQGVPDALTVFQIGSLSKLFTASLLQRLCDEGLLSMDSTLESLIGETIPLSPAAQQVTLRQLVTHTSGFPRVPKPLMQKTIAVTGKAGLMDNPYSHLAPEDIFDYLKTTVDKREPGRFRYSNFGMGLLAHVLEIVTKQSFEELVSEKVLAPLDMKSTSVTLTPAMVRYLAQGYTAKGVPSQLWTFSILAGAGAFSSNVDDMMKFVRANIEQGSHMSETLIKMQAPQFKGTTGIGWMQATFVDRFFGNRGVVCHNGMVGGYTAYMAINSQDKYGIVVLSNKSVDVTMLGIELVRQVRSQSWAAC